MNTDELKRFVALEEQRRQLEAEVDTIKAEAAELEGRLEVILCRGAGDCRKRIGYCPGARVRSAMEHVPRERRQIVYLVLPIGEMRGPQSPLQSVRKVNRHRARVVGNQHAALAVPLAKSIAGSRSRTPTRIA